MTMSDDHDTVKFLAAGFDGGEKVQDGSRGDALLFGVLRGKGPEPREEGLWAKGP